MKTRDLVAMLRLPVRSDTPSYLVYITQAVYVSVVLVAVLGLGCVFGLPTPEANE